MALIIKLLEAKPTNAGGPTTVYSSTATTIVANIRLAAKTSSGSADLKYLPGGVAANARWILDPGKFIALNDILVVKPEITLGPGDIIEVTTSVAMDLVVSGFTRD